MHTYNAWRSDCQPGRTEYIDSDFYFDQIDEQFEIDALFGFGSPGTLDMYFVGAIATEDSGPICGQGTFSSNSLAGVVMDFNDCTILLGS